jgi:hypothetical protein
MTAQAAGVSIRGCQTVVVSTSARRRARRVAAGARKERTPFFDKAFGPIGEEFVR